MPLFQRQIKNTMLLNNENRKKKEKNERTNKPHQNKQRLKINESQNQNLSCHKENNRTEGLQYNTATFSEN